MSVDDTVTWHVLGAAREVPDGEARAYTVEGVQICVVRDGDSYYAIEDMCTHGHAYLSEGYCDIAEGVIECPLHAGLFDFRSGEPAGRPVTKAVRSFPVEVAEGQLRLAWRAA